jgi:glycosyltransferase involved in cell wall biosynthesis
MSAPHRLRIVGDAALDLGTGPRRYGRGQGEVDFVGPIASRAALSVHYGEASVVVVPSIWGDPSPLVRLEAMAHGRPVVVFDSGGVGSVIEHEVTGILVARGDVHALARALDELLADAARARRMGRAARRKVERAFTRRRHAESMIGSLEQLRGGAPGRA